MSENFVEATSNHSLLARFPFGSVIRRSFSLFADHYGVYLGPALNDEAVFEITVRNRGDKFATVRIITLKTFSNDSEVVLAKAPEKPVEKHEIKRRIDEIINKDVIYYSILPGNEDSWNCESLAYYIAFGKRYSAQEVAVRSEQTRDNATHLAGIAAMTAICGYFLSETNRKKHGNPKFLGKSIFPNGKFDFAVSAGFTLIGAAILVMDWNDDRRKPPEH